MIKRRLITVLAVVSMMVGAMAPAALANGLSDQAKKEAAGWGCAADVGLPDGHCISPGTAKNFDKMAARGGTFQLQVFDADGNFLTAEIATFKNADDRACPHDPESPDGTYWDFVEDVLWVCHHQPG